MTTVCKLPSTIVPTTPSGHAHTIDLSISLMERFLRNAPAFRAPPCLDSPKYCIISDLFIDDYVVKRINGKMCYVQRAQPTPPQPRLQAPAPHLPSQHPRPLPQPLSQRPPKHVAPQKEHRGIKQLARGDKSKSVAPKMDHCSSPSSSEDSGINALGVHYMESCDEDSCEDEDDEDEDDEDDEDELSSDEDSSPASLWEQDGCTLLSPSKSIVEIIEKMETTV